MNAILISIKDSIHTFRIGLGEDDIIQIESRNSSEWETLHKIIKDETPDGFAAGQLYINPDKNTCSEFGIIPNHGSFHFSPGPRVFYKENFPYFFEENKNLETEESDGQIETEELSSEEMIEFSDRVNSDLIEYGRI